MLKNRSNCFQQNAFEKSLCDFYIMVVTELKMGFKKLKSHIVAYRDYKHFHNETLRSDIQSCASEKKSQML